MTKPADPIDPESRYEILDTIGVGGAGTVYRATDTKLRRTVAFKRLNRVEATGEQENFERTWREAMTLAAIQHPNILTIYDSGVDDEGPYVVTEFLDGKTLEDRVKEGPFTAAEFIDAASQILDAVGAAHHQGLVHRDLKPQNVMVQELPSGALQYKVLDFGLAKFISKPTRQTREDRGIFGSVVYMAPEQFEFQPLDGRTDLYSLGCMFYYMLSGQDAFAGSTFAQVISSHVQHAITPLDELMPGLSEDLCNWVMWLTNRDPEDRPASALEAAGALKAMAAGEALPMNLTTRVRVDESASHQSWKAAIGVTVILLLTAGAGFWWRSDRAAAPGTPPPVGSAYVFSSLRAFTEDFQSFRGAGFAARPQRGELSSHGWRVVGFSQGRLEFGATGFEGDWARGMSEGGTATGGIYAFDTGGGNMALGVQPSGSDFTPGDLTLRLVNDGSTVLTSVRISYSVWSYNDQGRSTGLLLEWSVDDEVYHPIDGSEVVTREEADEPASWTAVKREHDIANLSIPPDGMLYLRWTGTDGQGSAAGRDELALDDIRVEAIR